MAMAAASQLDESMNCFRTLKLLVEGGGYLSRELLKQKAIGGQTITLDTFLANKRTKINILKQKKILQDSQFDLLFPQNNTPTDITLWDITLTICILTNCLVLTPQEEKSINDIRTLRNTLYGHAPTLSMTDVEFQKSWKRVSTTLTTAAGLLAFDCQMEIAQMINRLETENLSAKERTEVQMQWFKWENNMGKKLDAIGS